MRKKLPKISTLRRKCDQLLTPITKLMYPRCVLCQAPTQVGHHHVKKSKSTRLRYELSNVIPLCNPCHLRLHCDETYWSSKIVEYYGLGWFEELDVAKNEIVKVDRFFYQNHYERLKKIHDELQNVEQDNS